MTPEAYSDVSDLAKEQLLALEADYEEDDDMDEEEKQAMRESLQTAKSAFLAQLKSGVVAWGSGDRGGDISWASLVQI